MKKFKNVILTSLSVVAVAVMAVFGTLAYLQDKDSDVNVMTLGEVKIEQHEYQRAMNNDGTYKTDTIDGVTSYVLEDFKQGKPLLPIVGDPNEPGDSSAYAGWDDVTVRMTQVDSYGGMQVFVGKNAQDKFVTVENTGKSDAYVRTLVAIEVGSTDGSLIHTSSRSGGATQPWVLYDGGIVSIDGNNYMLCEFVYRGASDVNRHLNGILPAGDTTYPNLCQVYLKHNATNEDMVAIDGNGNGTLDILVLSQAVQAAGFDNAKTALDTGFGKSSEKAAEWLKNCAEFVLVDGNKVQISGEEAAQILANLEDGKDLVVDQDVDIMEFDTNEVDANGATVTLNGVGVDAYGYLAFLPDAGENVTVSNLNVTGSGFVEVGHYGQGGGTYVLNNVKIENLASTLASTDKGFTLGCAFMHFGNATLNDCVMTGTTAIQGGAMPVDLASANGFTTVVNGGKYGTIYSWSHAFTTINGAEVDTIYTAPIKGTLTIKAGSHVGTINIAYGTSAKYATDTNLAKIIIEDGASVDAIVFNGTTYTLAEWLAR